MNTPEKSLPSAAQVVAFLEANPHFFVAHYDLLKELHLPHLRNAGATSFLQYKLSRVEREYDQYQRSILSAVEVAEENARNDAMLANAMYGMLQQGAGARFASFIAWLEAAFAVHAHIWDKQAAPFTLDMPNYQPWPDEGAPSLDLDMDGERPFFPQTEFAKWLPNATLKSLCVLPVLRTAEGAPSVLLVLGSENAAHFELSSNTSDVFLRHVQNWAQALLLADVGAGRHKD